MAEKILNTRVLLKIDTLENWNSSTLPLKKGELALATVAASAGTGLTEPVVMVKVGEDGVKTFKDLSWNFYAKASDVLSACKSEDDLTAFVNNVIANAGIASNSAMQELAGRVTTAEGEIDGLQAELDTAETGLKARMTTAEGAISALEGLVGEKNVATQISTAITELDLANTYDAKGAAAAVEGKLNTHAEEAAATYETKTDAAAKLTEAKGYTDTEVADVQSEVDNLEAYVGTIPTDEKYADITNVVAYINKKAEETLASASGNSTETAASVKAALDTYKAENDPKVQANTEAIDAIEADYLKAADKTELQDQIDVLEGLVGTDKSVSEQIAAVTDPIDARVQTIEDDYLTSADKTELQGQITTNANAIERLTNGVSAEEVDGVNDLIQYVKDHGTEVTGMQGDIEDNANAIAAIEADYLKAADKTELNNLITGLDTRMGTAEAAIETKAAQADLEALAGRVTTVEGDLNTETTGLKAKMAAAEAAIETLEGKHAEGTVAEQIAAVTDPMSERIEALEAIDHEHENKAVIDGITADQVSAWDVAVQTVTADTGLTATKTGTDVAIAFDDSVTFVFDCGDSTNV